MKYLLAAVLSIAAMPAFSAPQCGERSNILAQLAGKYGESRRMMGLSASGAVIEMFANDETGSWTATVTGPDGNTCLVASGRAFEAMAAPAPGIDG
jgi:hypothetical protein